MPPSDPPAHNRKRKASKPAKWGRRALAEAAQWAAQLTNWMPKKGLPRARQIAAALAKLGGQKAKRKRGKSSIRPTERLGTAESAPVVAPATPRETEVAPIPPEAPPSVGAVAKRPRKGGSLPLRQFFNTIRSGGLMGLKRWIIPVALLAMAGLIGKPARAVVDHPIADLLGTVSKAYPARWGDSTWITFTPLIETTSVSST